MRFERSAGAVVYRRSGDGHEIALIGTRTRAGARRWGLPKGRIEAGEAPEAAAVREAAEETGLTGELEGDLKEISYFFVWEGERVRKTVHFFLVRATGGDFSNHDHEVEEVAWYPADRAVQVASFKSEREVLEIARGVLRARPGP